MSISSQIFCDFPGELIHIILCYYTYSFKDLIKFSTINKTCKQISDHSLLWLEVKLMFYPPKQYVYQKGYGSFQGYDFCSLLQIHENYEETMEAMLLKYNFRTLGKELFSKEEVFPPVYKVSVTTSLQQYLTQHQTSVEKSDQDLAYLVGKWWKELFVKYQRFYQMHMFYYPYLNYLYQRIYKIDEIDRSYNYYQVGTVGAGIFSMYFLFDFYSTNLSQLNNMGFSLLLGGGFFYVILDLLFITNSVIVWLLYNNKTLQFLPKLSYFTPYNTIFIRLFSVLINLILLISRCVTSLGLDWWESTFPLWVGCSLMYGLWYYENKKSHDGWDLLIKGLSGAYLAITALIILYCRNINTGPFQYLLLHYMHSCYLQC